MKKNILFIMLSAFFLKAGAQQQTKDDTIYYLVDTLHTLVNDHMWDIDTEKGSVYKHYTIRCPCLIGGGNPTFFYDIKNKDESISITKKQLKAVKLVNLSYLILKSKQIENNANKHDYHIFLIEPNGKDYIMHEVSFENLAIHIVSLPDEIDSKIDTSTLQLKGAIQVDSKMLAKYVNQVVFTSGKVVGAQEIESDKIGLLRIGADSPNQDFTIIIKGDNLRNFYAMAFYKKRWLKVRGKVIEYMGKPAIEISNDKQIQQFLSGKN